MQPFQHRVVLDWHEDLLGDKGVAEKPTSPPKAIAWYM